MLTFFWSMPQESAISFITGEMCIRDSRGTLKLNTLKATLQMVNHLVEVAVSVSDTTVQDMSWFDFLDNITEPELIQYLKERRLYVNEPVNANTEEA